MIYTFDEHELDTQSYELCRAGAPLSSASDHCPRHCCRFLEPSSDSLNTAFAPRQGLPGNTNILGPQDDAPHFGSTAYSSAAT